MSFWRRWFSTSPRLQEVPVCLDSTAGRSKLLSRCFDRVEDELEQHGAYPDCAFVGFLIDDTVAVHACAAAHLDGILGQEEISLVLANALATHVDSKIAAAKNDNGAGGAA
jgi:hypothetical protein